MSSVLEVAVRQLHLDDHQVFARIFVSSDGGPIRTLITGREPHATGRFVSVKAGYRALPWESMRGELPLLQLAEVASPVQSVMVQPHRLEMFVEGVKKPLIYFPDVSLSVSRRFADALDDGATFARAVADWVPSEAAEEHVTLIVEAKTNDDRRIHDDVYQSKLRLAHEVYERLGWRFVQVVDVTGPDWRPIAKAVHEIGLDRDVVVSPHETQMVQESLMTGPATLADVSATIGGGAIALQKLAALHVRRLISIDLRGRLALESLVRPMTYSGRAPA